MLWKNYFCDYIVFSSHGSLKKKYKLVNILISIMNRIQMKLINLKVNYFWGTTCHFQEFQNTIICFQILAMQTFVIHHMYNIAIIRKTVEYRYQLSFVTILFWIPFCSLGFYLKHFWRSWRLSTWTGQVSSVSWQSCWLESTYFFGFQHSYNWINLPKKDYVCYPTL